jgi:enoyl-CoA hydratase
MISSEQYGRVTLLTIKRHEQRNALNAQLAAALLAAINAGIESGSRCLVLTGEGSSFCAGADLNIVHDDFSETMYALLSRMAEISVPMIAAVNGPAIGAGTQLAIACDLRVAAPRARFAIPTAKLGLAVNSWTVRRLASLAGGGAARAMLIGVDTVNVERAYGLGLVDRLGDLDDALAWAQEISTLAPLTIEYCKLAVNSATELTAMDPAVEKALAACWNSEDAEESRLARIEGRPPEFHGR